jgi:hypothetical protein
VTTPLCPAANPSATLQLATRVCSGGLDAMAGEPTGILGYCLGIEAWHNSYERPVSRPEASAPAAAVGRAAFTLRCLLGQPSVPYLRTLLPAGPEAASSPKDALQSAAKSGLQALRRPTPSCARSPSRQRGKASAGLPKMLAVWAWWPPVDRPGGRCSAGKPATPTEGYLRTGRREVCWPGAVDYPRLLRHGQRDEPQEMLRGTRMRAPSASRLEHR